MMHKTDYHPAYMNAAYAEWLRWAGWVLLVNINDMWTFAGMYNMGDMLYDNLPRSEG